MKRHNKLCVIKGVFDDIYFWGQGYKDLDTAENWNAYWENVNANFWRYRTPRHSCCSGDLVNTGGSIYMHPMGFDTVLHSCGVKCPRGHNNDLEDYFGSELDELKKLCEGVATMCGGTFHLYAEVVDIETELHEY